MKKIIFFTLFLATFVMSFISCKKENVGPDGNPLEIVNPDEVITFNLGVWDAQTQCQIEVLSDSVAKVTTNSYSNYYFSDGVHIGPSYSSSYYYYSNLKQIDIGTVGLRVYLTEMMNFGLKTSYDDYWSSDGRLEYKSYSIASVGITTGLTDISTIPTSGWSQSLSANEGEGYVVKAEGRMDGYSFVSYSRIWVKSWIQGASGGVLGAVVQYQPNWKKVYTPTGRMSLNQVRVSFGQANWAATSFLAENAEDGSLGIYCAPYVSNSDYVHIELYGTISSTPCSNNLSRLYYYEGDNYTGEYNWEIQSSTQTITAVDLNAHTISGKVEQLMKEESRGYSDVPLTVTFDEATWTTP